MNETPFLNRAKVKQFMLDHAKQTRAHKFTRVSTQALIDINEVVRRACVDKVRQQPSKGATII